MLKRKKITSVVKCDIKLKNTHPKTKSPKYPNQNQRTKPVTSTPELLKKALNKMRHGNPGTSIVQTGKVHTTAASLSALKYKFEHLRLIVPSRYYSKEEVFFLVFLLFCF